jgi:hypothetical protein
LHGFAWPDDAHNFHLDAPPDQQEAGRSLRLEVDDAGCGGSGDNPSAIFGASVTFGASTFGLERESEDSFDGRAEPFGVSAIAFPPGARGKLAGGLT